MIVEELLNLCLFLYSAMDLVDIDSLLGNLELESEAEQQQSRQQEPETGSTNGHSIVEQMVHPNINSRHSSTNDVFSSLSVIGNAIFTIHFCLFRKSFMYKSTYPEPIAS